MMMTPAAPVRLHAVLVFVGLVPATAVAQDALQWADLNTRVDSVFAQWNHQDSPGCAVGVYRNGEIVYARGYGMADLERGIAITPRTVFDIGSTSKQFAATSILLLARDGRLSLDDDVRRFIPELPIYSRPITIRHLLLHTSGLRDYIGLLTLSGVRIDDVSTDEDALAMIARQKRLNFEPGEEHLYSNSGYFLLSIIVERVAGRSLRDFAHEQIFVPLGMTRTRYLGSYDDIVPDRALAYSPRSGSSSLRTDMSRWLQLGDGAVFTTVEDLLLWDRNFYDGAVGGEALLAELQTPGALANGEPLTYALGLSLGEYRGARTVSHGGGWGGYRAELIRFPDQRFSVAALCNLGTINPTQLARRVADIYLDDTLEPARVAATTNAAEPGPSVEVPVATLLALAGSYRDPVSRTLRTFEFDDGVLYLQTTGPRYELRPHSDRRFQLLGAPVAVTVEFEHAADGGAPRMRWSAERQPVMLLDRIELVTPTAPELEEYGGRYHSDELQATFTVEPAGAMLELQRRGVEPREYRPTTRDEFSAGGMTLRFDRDPDGEVTGFLLNIGRIRDLQFVKMDGP